MRGAVILSLLLLMVSGWANALTLSPMKSDKLVYNDTYFHKVFLQNTSDKYTEYEVTLRAGSYDGDILYKRKEVLGGNFFKTVVIPITNIEPDNLQVYYLCAKELAGEDEWSIVGRVCGKLRLYWPRSVLAPQ